MSAALLRRQLAKIDAEVVSLHGKLTQLAHAREAVASELCRLTYPVLRLPNEITAEIFLKYAEEANLAALFVPAAVCSSWRAIALGLQSFWTTLRLHLTAGDKQPMQIDLAKIQVSSALARAGAHSLLDIDLSIDNGSVNHELEELLTLLSPTASRWRTLSASVGPPKLVHTILSWHLSQLTSLELSAFPEPIYSWTTTTPAHQPLAHCPLLRNVTLFDVDPDVLRLPWSHITHMELCATLGMTSREYIPVLAQTINLEVLDVYIGQRPEDSMEVHLPKLHTLTLRWHSVEVDGAVDFIDTLTAPALRNLTTNITSAANEIGINAIVELLERSDCPSLDSLALNSDRHELGFNGIEHIVGSAAPIGVLRLTEIGWEALEPLLLILGSGGIHQNSPFLVRELHIQPVELHIQPVSGAVPYKLLKQYIDARSDANPLPGSQSYALEKLSFVVPERLGTDINSTTEQDRAYFEDLASLKSPEVIVRGSEIIWELPVV